MPNKFEDMSTDEKKERIQEYQALALRRQYDKNNGISKTGEFTHVNTDNLSVFIKKLIEIYKNSSKWAQLTPIEQQSFLYTVEVYIKAEIIPTSFFLECTWPSSIKPFKQFSPGEDIPANAMVFDIPLRIKDDQEKSP